MQDETESDTSKKRRRRRRKEARPGEIIDAAMALWAERGFAATRLDDVARAADVAKGTIYLYFESKESLFASAVEARLVATMNKVADLEGQFEGGTEDLLRTAFGMIFAQVFDDRGYVFLKVLVSEGHRFPNLVERYREFAYARGASVIQRILKRGVERGELRAGAEHTDPRLVVAPAIVAGLWDVALNPDGPSQRDAIMEDFIGLLMNGLRAPAM